MTEAMRWRQASAVDAVVIRDLTRAAYARWVPLIGREPAPMTADYEAALTTHRFDLLEIDGALAGLIETRAEPNHLFIVNIAVSPTTQGRGLGSRLLDHAEALARDLGLGECRLHTNQRFEANVRLYLRHGYRVVAEDDVDVAVVVRMAKRLAG